jgi:indolepyruvate ferredoxin oxidoreductase alpha subunit
MIKELLYDEGIIVRVLGRSAFLPAEGELSTTLVLDSIRRLRPDLAAVASVPVGSGIDVPLRTRTQCVGCSYRGMLHALKVVTRKHNGIVTGDIGCHDAGSFPPIELQSTVFCMGSSIPMASGIAHTGLDRPVFAVIGDSTFFHNGMLGLANAVYNKARLVVIVNDNSTTAMTGFQPHPGSGEDARGGQAPQISVEKVALALGASVLKMNPYDIPEVIRTLEQAMGQQGVSVIVSSAPCYLLATRQGQTPFEPRAVSTDEERCNGCKICINDFGCPAIYFADDKAHIDEAVCVGCAMCVDVCKRGAMKWN